MRFLMMVKADSNYEAGVPPDEKLVAAIGKHAEEMMKAGILLATEGLAPSSKGARIRASGGKLTVIDGPFTEAKELVGGYAIIQASSKAEAIELGRRFMAIHQEVLGAGYEGELEIRQLFDFAPVRGCGEEAVDVIGRG